MKFFFSTVLVLLTLSTYSQDWLDNSCPIEQQVYNEDYTSAKSNNLLNLIIDQEGNLLVNGKRNKGISEIQFKELVYEFLSNPSKDKNKADSSKKAIVALGSYGEHEYYDLVLRYVREVYLYAWDTASEKKYNSAYVDLDCKKRRKIRNGDFPYNVLQLNSKKGKKKKNTFSGIPAFDGDVIDN